MIRELTGVDRHMAFIRRLCAHPDFRDPMLCREAQLRHNLLDAHLDPANRILGVFDGERLTGLFVFLVLADERYTEMLAGLSDCPDTYAQLLPYLRGHYAGYRADFIYNPKNRLLHGVLEQAGAEFEPEQQKLVLQNEVPCPPDSRVVPYSPVWRPAYLAMHTVDRYWTGERVLAAPERFHVLLAMENGAPAGYLDLSYGQPENEPYDLFVRETSRRRGLGRALLARAVALNRPNAMSLLVDIDNTAAITLYESLGFVKADDENNITASLLL